MCRDAQARWSDTGHMKYVIYTEEILRCTRDANNKP